MESNQACFDWIRNIKSIKQGTVIQQKGANKIYDACNTQKPRKKQKEFPFDPKKKKAAKKVLESTFVNFMEGESQMLH